MKKKKRVIPTSKRNPNPKKITKAEWLSVCCYKKARSFRRCQKRDRKVEQINIASQTDLTSLLFNWCLNNQRCVFCGDEFETLEQITINHNIPLSKGGSSLVNNLSPAHSICNNKHGNKFCRKDQLE